MAAMYLIQDGKLHYPMAEHSCKIVLIKTHIMLSTTSCGVLVAWHDSARCQNFQLVLQQVEESDRVVKVIHEQYVFQFADL